MLDSSSNHYIFKTIYYPWIHHIKYHNKFHNVFPVSSFVSNPVYSILIQTSVLWHIILVAFFTYYSCLLIHKTYVYTNYTCIHIIPVSILYLLTNFYMYPYLTCIQIIPVSKLYLYPNYTYIHIILVFILYLYPNYICIHIIPVSILYLYPYSTRIQILPVSK